MDRRTFLKSTGVAAATPLLSEFGSAASGSPAIKHIVVVMMENRSFDHLLGWLPNANGKQAGLSYPTKRAAQTPPLNLRPITPGAHILIPTTAIVEAASK